MNRDLQAKGSIITFACRREKGAKAPITMAEPRARAARHKGQLNFEQDLRALLYAFGDTPNPLPETVKVLDEIVTDFIIETCHSAASVASHSHRQKVKVDDFKFVLRKDELKLGRVQELQKQWKQIEEARKLTDIKDDALPAGVKEEKDKGKERTDDKRSGRGGRRVKKEKL